MQIELTGYRVTGLLRATGGDEVPGDDETSGGDGVPGEGIGRDVRPPGPGAAAVIFRGIRQSDRQPVALKVFHPLDASRAQREADLTALVDHPHVLPVLAVASGPGGCALVLPLAAGGSLADLLAARHRVRWTESLTVLIPIADALAAAHERDIVHGDVSAGNVLFDSDGRPLLADLGAARAAAEVGGEVATTPTDTAPEIARGASPAPAADLFSLGSVALRCLSGSPAWPADDLQDVLIQSTAGQWPDPDELMGPPDLLAIVRRLLDPDPARRGSAAQAAVELRRVGEPEPVQFSVRGADGTVRTPAPATMVRPDAVRPPGRAGRRHRRSRRLRWPAEWTRSARSRPAAPAGRHHRRRRWRRGWPVVGAVALVLLLGAGAVRAGLWWSGWGDTSPVAAPPAAGPSVPVDGRPISSVTGASSPTSSVTPDPATGTAGALADRNWMQVVATLDAARAAALTARDARLLDRVYTDAAPARAADARRIAAMTTAGYHVTDAGHRLTAATFAGVDEHGTVTIRVTGSLPPYPVLGADGSVVGRSAASASSVVVLELRPTADGYRISGGYPG